MRVTVTGFESFGNESSNPTQQIIYDLKAWKIEGVELNTVLLPVSIEGIERYSKLIMDSSTENDVFIGLGLAGGRTNIAVERVAINYYDFPIKDNNGVLMIDQPIRQVGLPAYFSSLPIKRIVTEWNKVGLSGYISNTAGTYVCNGLFYLLNHNKKNANQRVGFIHVPYANEMSRSASSPSILYDDMVKAVKIAIETSVNYQDDVKVIGGALC